MDRYILLPLISFLLLNSCTNNNLTYPKTDIIPISDNYYGEKISDNYRWLENDMSDKTKDWVERQNNTTFTYLNQIKFREDLKQRFEKIWNYEKLSSPFFEGDYVYYYRNNGLQNQYVLYRKKDGAEEVFLDPNKFSDDGTISLSGLSFSKDGNIVCYSISDGGSDWRKMIVMDTESKKIIEDTLVDIKFSGISWKGNEGFFYSSYDRPKKSELSDKTDQHKLYYHKLGTKQKAGLYDTAARPGHPHIRCGFQPEAEQCGLAEGSAYPDLRHALQRMCNTKLPIRLMPLAFGSRFNQSLDNTNTAERTADRLASFLDVLIFAFFSHGPQ